MAKKERADHILYEQGLSDTLEQATRLIMAGHAHFLKNGQKTPVEKPGMQLDPSLEIVVKGKDRFVSRGGYKLLTAIDELGLNPAGKIAMDAGASTGGFTDCMLQFGAIKIYAADVGYGQLHWKLQQDERVINLERVNLRLAEPDLIPEKVDLVVCDVSFISLKKILPSLVRFLKDTGEIVCLIKPQFEVAQGQTDKGIVRDENLRKQTVDMIVDFASSELQLTLKGLVPSSIKGPKGNQEYLAYFIR